MDKYRAVADCLKACSIGNCAKCEYFVHHSRETLCADVLKKEASEMMHELIDSVLEINNGEN